MENIPNTLGQRKSHLSTGFSQMKKICLECRLHALGETEGAMSKAMGRSNSRPNFCACPSHQNDTFCMNWTPCGPIVITKMCQQDQGIVFEIMAF